MPAGVLKKISGVSRKWAFAGIFYSEDPQAGVSPSGHCFGERQLAAPHQPLSSMSPEDFDWG
ncbi:hypothetical protein HPB48_019854 [Haemaphysalis longicornis]|uniref:Uncharacterized protein n=1 Tax=Haemaphysalis longicornis TaxID=44386 RepID=A0A9J6GAD6_HAELO|nr:hypothetical protein HPB48_019854 [Haemaphysalis longicornis]